MTSFLSNLFDSMDKAKEPKQTPKDKLLDFEKMIRDDAKANGIQPRTHLENLCAQNETFAQSKVVQMMLGEYQARQLKNPKTEVLVVKDGKVITIDKKDLAKYKANGYELAEAHGGKHTTSGRSMTKGEEGEKERLVKGMKKNKSDFKKRYGKDADAVMYATATKNAMEDESLVEGTMIGGIVSYKGQDLSEFQQAYKLYKQFMSQPRPANDSTISMIERFLSNDEVADEISELQMDPDSSNYVSASADDVRTIVQAKVVDDLNLFSVEEYPQLAKWGYKNRPGEDNYEHNDLIEPNMATEAFGDGLTDQQLIGLSAIADKYMGRKGGNGDALPIGVLKYKDATGVQTDGYDVEEMEAYAKKIGKDWDEWEDETDEFYIQSKISRGLQDALEKVMGDEDFYSKPVGEKVYDFFSNYEEDDTIEINVNKFIPLAGDSGSEKVKNLKQVKVDFVVIQNPYQQGGYMDGKKDGGLRDVKVQHDGPWAIYGDSGFEKAISKIVGFEVSFTEQGLQQDGQADMEGFMKNKGIKELDTKQMEDDDGNPYRHNGGEDQVALVNSVLWRMKDIYLTYKETGEVHEDDLFGFGLEEQWVDGIEESRGMIYQSYDKFLQYVNDAVNKAGEFKGQSDSLEVDLDLNIMKKLFDDFKTAASKKLKGQGIKEGQGNSYGHGRIT